MNISKRNIKVRALEPILTIKHVSEDETARCNLYKYKKGKYNEYLKSRLFKRNEFNEVYIIKENDYIYKSHTFNN